MSYELRITCYLCDGEIEAGDWADFHNHHRPGCSNQEGCDCNYKFHPGCCPICNRIAGWEEWYKGKAYAERLDSLADHPGWKIWMEKGWTLRAETGGLRAVHEGLKMATKEARRVATLIGRLQEGKQTYFYYMEAQEIYGKTE